MDGSRLTFARRSSRLWVLSRGRRSDKCIIRPSSRVAQTPWTHDNLWTFSFAYLLNCIILSHDERSCCLWPCSPQSIFRTKLVFLAGQVASDHRRILGASWCWAWLHKTAFPWSSCWSAHVSRREWWIENGNIRREGNQQFEGDKTVLDLAVVFVYETCLSQAFELTLG